MEDEYTIKLTDDAKPFEPTVQEKFPCHSINFKKPKQKLREY